MGNDGIGGVVAGAVHALLTPIPGPGRSPVPQKDWVKVADDAFRSKAISLVLAGGVVSALFGPETAKWSRDLFAPALFAGCYAMIVGLCVAAAILIYFVDLPNPAPPVFGRRGRPLAEIAAQPVFIAAAAAAMVGYGVMSLVMTATPIAMLDCGHEFAAAAFVIQWHSLGMFAPSFVTGHLISRFGLTRIMLTGAVLLLLCSFINLSGLATLNFWAANVALGVGWNFLFVGATTLLTRTYAGPEKGKVQALNDFLVFGTVTLSSFASGAMLSGAGWIMVQIAVMPFVVVAGVAVLWWRHRDASSTAMLRPAEPL
jgi:hypothetical protein